MAKKRPRNVYNDKRVTWAHAFRDVAIRSLSRGQFIPFLLFVLIVIFLLRLPSESIAELAYTVVVALKDYEFIAYILLIITLILWFWQARWSRKQFHKEFERIGKEKSDLQNKLKKLRGANKGFNSSED